MKVWLVTTLCCIGSLALQARAQDDSAAAQEAIVIPSDNKDVEQLYDKFENDETARKNRQTNERRQRQPAKPDLTSLSELSALSPFEDVAVIERKFLPKTGRFELSGSGLTGLNNPFFNNLGMSARLAYYFREKYGVELMYYYISAADRDATKNLLNNRHVATNSLVSPKGFIGGAFKWNPIYGKVTFLNNRIVPFDLNFSLGAGTTQTSAGSPFTVHVGTSQNFALSKAWAVRWDLAWNFYQVKQTDPNAPKVGTQIDLFLGVGVSFFFPEATYR